MNKIERDYIVAFTIFGKSGFRTMYRHFSSLKTAKIFASNVNIKNNCMIYKSIKEGE